MRVIACKAALCCFIWYRSKTAGTRRKPVRIDRFHFTHSCPAKPYPLPAMKMLLHMNGVALKKKPGKAVAVPECHYFILQIKNTD